VSAGNITFGAANTGSITLSGGAITYGANPVFTINGTGTLAHGPTVGGAGTSLTKSGTGTLGLSANSNYAGAVIVNGGALVINNMPNFGSSSGLGQKASNLASNLVLDGGTLRVQVNSATSDRLFTVGSGGATFEAINFGGNSGQILLAGSTAVAYTGVGNRTITVGGTSDDTGGSFIARNIGDVGGGNGQVALAKTGSHSWTLNGTNTYSGGTTVTAGSLTMGIASALGSTSGQLTVNGGTLNLAGNNLAVGNLTGAGGTISGTSGSRTLTIGTGDFGGGNFQGTIADGSGGTTALTKNGTGTITLSGANSYTGATSINAGTLLVNGSTSAASSVSVGLSGTLGGNGTINGATTVNGALRPGNSPGVLAFTSALTLNGTTVLEINGTATRGIDFDGVNTGAGLLTYGGALTFDLGTTLSGNQTFDLFSIGGGNQTGNFTSVALSGNYTGSLTRNGSVWALTDGGGNNWSFSQSTGDLTFIAVPEPAAMALVGTGVAMLVVRLNRRRKA
jgi:fibronectin-binding autotransporter adhesin